MILKVCGLTANASGRSVASLPSVTHVGFIFYPLSKRYTTVTFETSKKKVGVFVNADLSEVKKLIDFHQLDIVQLHGEETPEYISALGNSVEIFKAIGVETEEDLLRTSLYEGLVSTLLFDKKSIQKGGTGAAFDWKLLAAYEGETPFILSGGLGVHHLDALKSLQHPRLIGYDLNSNFETAPCEKDIDLIKSFNTYLYENIFTDN